MKSSFCNFGDCVEVEFRGGLVWVTDSHSPVGELAFTREEWTQFLAGVKNGEFDLPVAPPGPQT